MLRIELVLGYELEYSFITNWRAIYNELEERDLQDAFKEAVASGHIEVVALLLQDERGVSLKANGFRVDPSADDNEAKR